ncbi:hypothetical protein BFP76_14350 [Amylibacter kogurei]|uniref:Nudix hydrolase domain-containing protein n=1 Tax=Paramylibacter kogurei TaxID=1889778 RepID=A0A2G5KAS4_9RHOB|nr:NUDIX hydrolase [Amylibacter kogurei]PIB26133.1 hypothetical protein BFP76_14350 [Amylibacter kogurei]
MSEFELLTDWPECSVSVVGIVIQDELQRAVIQLRDNFPNVGAGGRWGMFGGHMEDGETTLETAMRELTEETGLEVDANCLMPFVRFVPRDGYQAYHYIYHLQKPIAPKQIAISEGAGFAFITYSQMRDFDMLPSNILVLNHLHRLNKFAI